MVGTGNELAVYLNRPERLATAGLEEWDRLFPMARRAGLLGRVAALVARGGGLDAVPRGPRAHLIAAQVMSERHQRDTRYDVDRVADLLSSVVGRVILLKGAAYLALDLPPAPGRIFSDIDILVPRELLLQIESILGIAGWRIGELDPYDLAYYRRWSHQLPPLVNAARGSAIDVHHTLVPLTARIALDADELLRHTVAVPGRADLAVLAPPDMVLHSAVHLFNEGEYARGLRDLDDLNRLLRHFAAAPDFWPSLTRRAELLDLTRPLFYALRYTAALLGTPVPDDVMRQAAAWAPARPKLAIMDAAFARALRSPHPDCADWLTRPALKFLYIRAHYLRMPLHLLVPHLLRKAMMRTAADRAETADPQTAQ